MGKQNLFYKENDNKMDERGRRYKGCYKRMKLLLHTDIVYRQFKIFFLFIADKEARFFQVFAGEVRHIKGTAPERRIHTAEWDLDSLPVACGSEVEYIRIILAAFCLYPKLVGFTITL